MKHTILVTGGTGFIGSWVVKGLLENGHTVRLTVRNKANVEKYQYLESLSQEAPGHLEIWEADLLKAGSYDEPTNGCDIVAHIASPFILTIKDPQKDLIDPAVKGTQNVLEAANRSGTVKKIVLTSSVAAIHGDSADMKNQNLTEFDESHFNTTSSLNHQPYSFSKVEAEKKAWEIAKAQSDWKLVVMNPAFVMGPSLSTNSKSESLKFMTDMLTGVYKTGAPELYFGFVDVRDVAKAHIYSIENEAEGRHILSESVNSFMDVAEIIKQNYGKDYKVPTRPMPKWLAWLVGPLFGVTRKFVKNNIGIPIKLNNTRSKTKLNLDYMPVEQTVVDMIEHMKSLKIV